MDGRFDGCGTQSDGHGEVQIPSGSPTFAWQCKSFAPGKIWPRLGRHLASPVNDVLTSISYRKASSVWGAHIVALQTHRCITRVYAYVLSHHRSLRPSALFSERITRRDSIQDNHTRALVASLIAVKVPNTTFSRSAAPELAQDHNVASLVPCALDLDRVVKCDIVWKCFARLPLKH